MQIYTKPAKKAGKTACKSLKIDFRKAVYMITETLKPDPDSQFRLVPCKCGGEPVYQHYVWEEVQVDRWSVECPKCKRGTLRYHNARHDAQLEWNGANK